MSLCVFLATGSSRRCCRIPSTPL